MTKAAAQLKKPKKRVAKKEVKKSAMASLRARKAMKIALENGGKVGPAMREAGFSEAYVKNPQKIKETEGWKELLKKTGLDDDTLLKKSKQHLSAQILHQMQVDPEITDKELIEVFERAGGSFVKSSIIEVSFTNKKGEVTSFMKKQVFYTMPDNQAQDRALDKLFKIRGAYSSDDPSAAVAVQFNAVIEAAREERNTFIVQ